MMTGYMYVMYVCYVCMYVHKTSMDKTINIIPLPSYLIISNKNVKMFPVPGCTGTLSIHVASVPGNQIPGIKSKI